MRPSLALSLSAACIGAATSAFAAPVLPPANGVQYQQPQAIVPRGSAPTASQQQPGAVYGRLGVSIGAADIYRQPDPRAQILYRAKERTQFAVRYQTGGWYAVLMADGSIGFVPQTHVQLLDYAVASLMPQAPPTPPAPTPNPSFPPAQGDPRSVMQTHPVLRVAQEYLNVRYVWGGNGKDGVDCSGLVQDCFAACGVKLPRRAGEQSRVGEAVDAGDLQPGDRLYFAVKGKAIDHTGIYVGNGYFVHASVGRGKVDFDQLSRPLYSRSLVAIRR